LLVIAGCQSYTESTPHEVFEGDNAANFKRVFGQAVPVDVTVMNSIVVGYAWRPGVITSDDYEFEVLASPRQITKWVKKFYLLKGSRIGLEKRKSSPIRPWYAPKPLTDYETYCDATSVGYVHMLVDRTAEPDGRLRVFFSKH
jgi:hypothetical protein